MRRRTLLATVGAGLAAGCSESIPLLDPEETPSETDDAPPGPDTPPESPPTTTDEPTDSEPTDTTEQTTEEPTRAEREAAQLLARARTKLGEAHASYVGFAGGERATLLDVTVATEVNVAAVTNHVGAAQDALADMPRRAGGDQITAARRLRRLAAFYREAVRCQNALGDAYGEFEFVVGRLFADQTGLVSDSTATIRENRETAAGHLDTIEDESTAEDAAALDALDSGTYTAKVGQFRRAISAFGTLPATLGRVKRGFDAFRRGGDAYLDEQYFEARRAFETVGTELDPASDTLSSLDAPAPMTDAVDDLTAVSNTLVTAAVDLELAADAGTRGSRGDRQTAFADAQAHLEDATVAPDRLEIVRRLLRR
ncbi:hypothetical protein ACOZ4N_15520 [Halorientalis pallida]|uniref:hypothetical protein n=1 Tax=Halorientalis pallida TaxID=2479928 RepID=UPI003C6F3439